MQDRDALLAGLKARPLPAWYDESKFGIFIHWGLFAIPAFASGSGSISDAFKTDYDRAVAMTPYTEWYANAIRVAGTPSAAFHAREFGGAPYEAFRDPFLAGLGGWDPSAWAEAFRAAGARYVVMVTKHHDGFCLWPSRIANPNRADWTSPRDLVGELAAAVRAAGLAFGVYYSGGIDWSFNPEPLRTLADFIASTPGGAYPAYAEAQTRELIERYEPAVLWNDISWPTDEARLFRLFADYYAAVPEGVVNDRWTCRKPASRLLRMKLARRWLDARIKAAIARDPAAFDGVTPPRVPHSDFRTPEYRRFPDVQAGKWESTRGMSHSFGFNRNDTEADYAGAEALIGELVDCVSKNGNFLLNVGPMADGALPAPQLVRLKAIGAWLAANGAAVLGAKPWRRAQAKTADGAEARFTRSGEALNIIVLAAPKHDELRLVGVGLEGEGRLLATGAPVSLTCEGEDTLIRFARPLTGAFGPVIKVGSLRPEQT